MDADKLIKFIEENQEQVVKLEFSDGKCVESKLSVKLKINPNTDDQLNVEYIKIVLDSSDNEIDISGIETFKLK